MRKIIQYKRLLSQLQNVSDKDGEDIDEILAEKNLPVEIPTAEQNIPEKDLVDEEETPEAGAASGGDAASITDDLEAELEMDLDNLKLDDIDTSDVNLDDEGLLEDWTLVGVSRGW